MKISDVLQVSRSGYVVRPDLIPANNGKYTYLENNPDLVIHSQKYNSAKNISSGLENNDVMFGSVNPDGTRFSTILKNIEANTITNQKNIIVREKGNETTYLPEYIKLVLDLDFTQDWVNANTDNGKNYLTADVFSQFPFPQLSLEKQSIAANDKLNLDDSISLISQKIHGIQDEIDDTYKGLLDQGYNVTLFDRARFKDGRIMKDLQLSEDGEYSIITKNNTDQKQVLKTIDYREMEKSDLSTERKVIPLKSKDILLRVGGSQRRAYLLEDIPSENIVSSNEFLTIVPKMGDRNDPTEEGGATSRFTAFAINSKESQNWIKDNSVVEPGDGAKRITSKAVLSYLPFPSISVHEQNIVMDDIDSKKDRINNLFNQISLLKKDFNKKYNSLYGNELPEIEVVPKRVFESQGDNAKVILDKLMNKNIVPSNANLENINELSLEDNSSPQPEKPSRRKRRDVHDSFGM
jgi:hypothetical protein